MLKLAQIQAVPDAQIDDLLAELAVLRSKPREDLNEQEVYQLKLIKTLLYPLIYGASKSKTGKLADAFIDRNKEQLSIIEARLVPAVTRVLSALQLPPYARNPIDLHLAYSEEQVWDCWVEGQHVDGGIAKASFFGQLKGFTFASALATYAAQEGLSPFIRIPSTGKGRPTYYGAGLFLTEAEARASNG